MENSYNFNKYQIDSILKYAIISATLTTLYPIIFSISISPVLFLLPVILPGILVTIIFKLTNPEISIRDILLAGALAGGITSLVLLCLELNIVSLFLQGSLGIDFGVFYIVVMFFLLFTTMLSEIFFLFVVSGIINAISATISLLSINYLMKKANIKVLIDYNVINRKLNNIFCYDGIRNVTIIFALGFILPLLSPFIIALHPYAIIIYLLLPGIAGLIYFLRNKNVITVKEMRISIFWGTLICTLNILSIIVLFVSFYSIGKDQYFQLGYSFSVYLCYLIVSIVIAGFNLTPMLIYELLFCKKLVLEQN